MKSDESFRSVPASDRGAAPVAPPPGGRRKRLAFTLVELLLVIAIISLLLAMIAPSLGRTRALALRASCQVRMRNLGSGVGMYVGEHKSYPNFGTWGLVVGKDGNSPWRRYGYAWPKLAGIMQANGLPGTMKTSWYDGSSQHLEAYVQEADEVWQGALCPAMDAGAIWMWLDERMAEGSDPNPAKGGYMRAAIGYQWNYCLRAATPGLAPSPHCGLRGRWHRSLERIDDHPNTYDHPKLIAMWIDACLYPPGGANQASTYYSSTGCYHAQAVRPDELYSAATTAEAWDSPDIETAPNMNFGQAEWRSDSRGGAAWPAVWNMENLQPGWHSGPYNRDTNGWALLNGSRHPDSPNVLYADGSVRADARRRVDPSELRPYFYQNGSYEGLKVNSWEDYDSELGTLNHIVPWPEFYK